MKGNKPNTKEEINDPLDWMKKMCRSDHYIESVRLPQTIEAGGKLYRFATNGWALVAVEVEDGIDETKGEKYSELIRTWLEKKLEVTGRAPFAALREFCGAPWITRCHCGHEHQCDPAAENEDSVFLVRKGFIGFFGLNLELLSRPLSFLSAETIDIEIPEDPITEPLFIDGPGWRIVIMGMKRVKANSPRFELIQKEDYERKD